MLEVTYVLTERGERRIASACPKCGTLPPRTTLRGVTRVVTCPLCETEYAHRAPCPAMPPPARPTLRQRVATAFAEWLGGAP